MNIINLPEPRIDVVSLGVSERADLSVDARQALARADCVIGSSRQLQTIADCVEELNPSIEQRVLPKLSQLQELITKNQPKRMVVLASGDALYYGIGRWFTQHFECSDVRFHPAVSSIQAACHRIGLSLQDARVWSVHGRPLESIRTQLKPSSYLIVLVDKHSTPKALAKECLAAGFESTRLTVCEQLGYAQERVREFSVQQLLDDDGLQFDPLHLTILRVSGLGSVLPTFPGIADERFVTGAEPGKGMISKREVRLCILSYLQPADGDVIWDVGAGCGSVSVELAYWNERVQVYAVECHLKRLEYLSENRDRFGVVMNMHVVQGRAPDCLASLPAANKVFVGGSNGVLPEVLNNVWRILPVGGVLVASAVQDVTRDHLKSFAQDLQDSQVESMEIAVQRGHWVQGETQQTAQYHSKLPVEVFRFVKVDKQ